MAYAQGDYPAAEEYFQEALRLSQLEGHIFAEGHTWGGMALVEIIRPDYGAATSRLEKAITLFERCDEDYLTSVLRITLGTMLQARGEGERAERAFEEARAEVQAMTVEQAVECTLGVRA